MNGIKSAGRRGLRVIKNLQMFADFARWHLFGKPNRKRYSTPDAKQLREDGVTTVDNFLPDGECSRIKTDIEELLEGDDEDAVYITADNEKGIDPFDPSNGAVVQDRSGGGHDHDEGMIDIFHVDQAIDGLEPIIESEQIREIVSEAAGENYDPEILHAYINRSVTETRPLHSDMQGVPEFKAFIYLTDVPNESYGPYRYSRGSHRSIIKRLINNILGALFDHPGVDMRYLFNAEPILADKGALIVSNQSGVHRGTPQEPGKERMLLAIRYRP